MEQIAVLVRAADPISQAGVITQLRASPDLRIVEESDCPSEPVCLVVVDQVDECALNLLRSVSGRAGARTVLVVSRADDAALVKAIEVGVLAVIMRSQATTNHLISVIRGAARGDGAVPPELLGRLLLQVGQLQRQVLAPRGLTVAGLAQREIDVLRLVADGLDTAEIASELSYSERTVKTVLHDITSRLQLRNRSQAVAYAIREGLI